MSSAFKVLLLGMMPVVASQAQTPTPQLALERLAQISGSLEAPGLDSVVEVRRDRWGIPHIYAKTQHDLFFAQGFVAAQDRLFQMEMWRRIGEGKLAEVLGPSFVARDRFARLLKYRGAMAAEWASYAPDTKAIVTAFVSGVNAYVDRVRDRPPVEFTLLGFAPEHWSPEVPLQRLAALSMTLNADTEVLRAQLIDAIGAERASALWPTIPRRALDPAPGLSFKGITTLSLGAYAAATGPVRYPRVTGSNNWVVSGALTTTGKPLLANDPHRYLDTPALRYLTHLVAPGWNVIGAGEPGVPGVAAGHNERVGFGFTIVMMDQQDVYIETVGPCPGTPPRRCYLNRGAWKPLRLIIDTIAVKGGAGNIVRLEFTEHGPIIGEDAIKDAAGRSRAFALRFVGSEPGTAGYLAQISVNRATDWASFAAAAERWKLPTENLVYADVDGNIGWIAAGLMPKRHWSGLLPVPGTGGYEWTGFRRPDELPRSFNPSHGHIVTANHDIRPQGYETPLSFEFSQPQRAQRIAEVLGEHRAGRRFSVRDFQQLQHDELSIQARTLVPMLLAAARSARVDHQWAFTTLAAWDFVMRADQAAPAVFEAWRKAFSTSAVRHLALDAAAAAILGESWIDDWSSPEIPLSMFPTATRDSLFLAAMNPALAVLRRRLGADSTAWRWGRLHVAGFSHRIGAAYDLPTVERGGNGHTVNSTAGSDYGQQYGASFREILDFDDWDRSVATSVPGQSGQPGSEFYSNLLPLWSRGEYFPLVFSRAAVERETRYVLWLTPPLTQKGERR